MAFLGIGKKKSAQAVAADAGSDTPPETNTPRRGLFGRGKSAPTPKPAKGPGAARSTQPTTRKPSGDLDIYTAVLAAAFIALAAGCVLIALDNLAGVEGTSDEGNPFAVVSSR